MERYDIFNCAWKFFNCCDDRPWIIVDLYTDQHGNDLAKCCGISGQCYQGNCFLLEFSHPDFAATGLKKTCYIHYEHTYDIPFEKLLRRRGKLQNQMLEAFLDESGFA